MRHPNDGMLRRLCDEPLSVPVKDRAHIDSCARCQERLREIRETALQVAAILSGPRPEVNAIGALHSVQVRLATEGAVPAQSGLAGRLRVRLHSLTAPLAAGAAALVVAGSLLGTPAGSLAARTLGIFHPNQVAALPVTMADLRSLASLRRLGTTQMPRDTQSQTVSSAVQASQLAGMTVLTPSSLPAGVPSTVMYSVMQPQTSTFTFSAARVATAVRNGKRLPALPGDMNGSTLQVRTGAAVLALYGSQSAIPALAIGQMRAPTVSSSGASVEEMENYILSLPGISPQLAASIRALGDPTRADILPVPIPVSMATSQSVTVQGVRGLEIGDSTGVGSVVVWEKAGIIYGVGGSMTESQALAVANSLR